jgi:hypothetical protein
VVSLPEQEVAGELAALAGYRFDLSADIPIRAQVYSVGPEQHVWGLWCITSLLMAGLWLRWSGIWARRIGRG